MAKLAQSPTTGISANAIEARVQVQRTYAEEIGLPGAYDDLLKDYEAMVKGGDAAVPWTLTITGHLQDETALGKPWARASIQLNVLSHPFTTHEFLRLRALPDELARQLKGMVAPGRHLQKLPDGTIAKIIEAGEQAQRADLLRRYSLVRASTPDAAGSLLVEHGRALIPGDAFYVAQSSGLGPLYRVDDDGNLRPEGSPMPLSAVELRALFVDVKERAAAAKKWFPARPGLLAADQLAALIEGGEPVVAIDNFAHFHDRYVLLDSRTTQAHALQDQLPKPQNVVIPPSEDDEAEATSEEDELVQLEGLSVTKLREQLEGIEIADEVLAEAITAIRAGKHLLLSGPPGTGKSTVAEALCRAVVGKQYDVTTATADWTTFDTIGGYVPNADGNQSLSFEPGVVLRTLAGGRWLVIDELNRADIDKAFGPLFTLLGGTTDGLSGRSTVLPFQQDGASVEVKWAQSRAASDDRFVITPGWRLIGTLNISDKASLFQLSFAFLRRFAVIDIPLPSRGSYTEWFRSRCLEIPETHREPIVEAAMNLAHAVPMRELGPAILLDVARFVGIALLPTADGIAPYADPLTAFLTAARLFTVPQFEGATAAEVEAALKAITTVWPDDELPAAPWRSLTLAFRGVAMA